MPLKELPDGTPSLEQGRDVADTTRSLQLTLRSELYKALAPNLQTELDAEERTRLIELQEQIAQTGVTLPHFAESVDAEGVTRLSFDAAQYRREFFESQGSNDMLRDMGNQPRIDGAIRKREHLASHLRTLREKHTGNTQLETLYKSNQQALSALRLSRQHASYVTKTGAVVRDIQDEKETNIVSPQGDDWINPYMVGFPSIIYDVEYTGDDASKERYLYAARGYTSVNRVENSTPLATEKGNWAFPILDRQTGASSYGYKRKKVQTKVTALPLPLEEGAEAVGSNNLERFVGKSLLRLIDPMDSARIATMTDQEKREKGYKRTFELSAVGDLVADKDGKVNTPSGKLYDKGTAEAGEIQVRTATAMTIPTRAADGTLQTDAKGKVIGEIIQQPFFGDMFDRRRVMRTLDLPFTDKKMERLSLKMQRAIGLFYNRLDVMSDEKARKTLALLRTKLADSYDKTLEAIDKGAGLTVSEQDARGTVDIAFGIMEYELDEIEERISPITPVRDKVEASSDAPLHTGSVA